jgi:hypothetical protein
VAEIAKRKQLLVHIRKGQKPSRGDDIRYAFLKVLLAPIGFVLIGGYKLLIGWWANPRAVRKNQREFADGLRAALPFLFEEHGATVIPTEDVPSAPGFDYAYVTIAVEPVLLRFLRGRGEFTVEITSKFAPKDWQYLDDVLAVVSPDTHAANDPQREQYSLRNIERALKPQFAALRDALDEPRYEATLNAAAQRHNDEIDARAAYYRERGVEATYWTPKT